VKNPVFKGIPLKYTKFISLIITLANKRIVYAVHMIGNVHNFKKLNCFVGTQTLSNISQCET
jgi:hypothetical protein